MTGLIPALNRSPFPVYGPMVIRLSILVSRFVLLTGRLTSGRALDAFSVGSTGSGCRWFQAELENLAIESNNFKLLLYISAISFCVQSVVMFAVRALIRVLSSISPIDLPLLDRRRRRPTSLSS